MSSLRTIKTCINCGQKCLMQKTQFTCNKDVLVSCLICGEKKTVKCNTRIHKLCKKCAYNIRAKKTSLSFSKTGILKTNEYKEKLKNTNLKKYGVEYPGQIVDANGKKRSYNAQIKKYGCLGWNTKKQKQTMIEKYGEDKTKYNSKTFKKWANENREYINKKTFETKKKNGTLNRSNLEEEVCKYIESLGVKIIRNDTKTIGLELDILSENIAIEFNGTYWRSQPVIDKMSHYNKTILCREKNIHLIHIYEDEWVYNNNKIKDFLSFIFLKQNAICARNCEIKKMNKDVYHKYCEENHLQGANKIAIKDLVVYGLYYNDELVQLMSFARPQRSKKYEWEIIRGCPGDANRVIGGNSKLFKHFIKEKNPSNIVSYCDIDKFDEKSYLAIGMKLVKRIDKIYYSYFNGNKRVFSSYLPRQQANMERLFNKKPFVIYAAGTEIYEWRETNENVEE